MKRMLVLALLQSLVLPAVAADSYPTQTARVIVPFPPGGGTDSIARMIARQLSDQLGKSFVVENRTGASGIVGTSAVAKAAPDGHWLLLADISFSMLPGTVKSLPYDPLKDFQPITQIIRSPQALVVIPSLKVANLKEFIALAQARPGQLNYGSGGAGTAPHLSAEFFKMATKTRITHVPYKGAADVIAGMLAGQVEMHITSVAALVQQVNAGKLRALAVTTDGRRVPLMPDVPSMAEAGLQGLDIYTWHGLSGPAGMPREVVNKLQAEVARAIAQPAMQAQFAAQGMEPVGSTPDEFAAFIRREMQRWSTVIKAAGITPE